MFCGKDRKFGKMTAEHFIPKGMWDGPRPSHTRTVPAHRECNNRYAEDNEYFRDAIALSESCIRHPEVLKLNLGSIRRKLRKQRGAFIKNFPDMGLKPVYSESGLYLGHAPQYTWNWDRIETVLKNVMKGIFFTLMKHPMPQEMELSIGHIRDEHDLIQVNQVVNAMCPWTGFGDDVFGCRAVFHSQDKYMFCLMQFYRSERFYGRGVLREASKYGLSAPAPLLNQ
jgi:hypothetical protein